MTKKSSVIASYLPDTPTWRNKMNITEKNITGENIVF